MELGADEEYELIFPDRQMIYDGAQRSKMFHEAIGVRVLRKSQSGVYETVDEISGHVVSADMTCNHSEDKVFFHHFSLLDVM